MRIMISGNLDIKERLVSQDICYHLVGVSYQSIRRESRLKNVRKGAVRHRIELIQDLKRQGFCENEIVSLLAGIELAL